METGHPGITSSTFTNLPQWLSLFREGLEVFVSKQCGWQSLQPKVGPTLNKLHQRLKGVQSQAVVTVVRQMGHEDADLQGLENNASLKFWAIRQSWAASSLKNLTQKKPLSQTEDRSQSCVYVQD